MRARPRTFRLGLAVATLAAFVLRVWNLGGFGDLDFDEQASFFIGSMPLLEMLAYLVRAPFEHPPGFYLLFHAWLGVVGPSESAMRMFSVLAGTMAVPVVGLAASGVAGPRAGIVAAGFLAIMPLHVFYSRDARMYALLALLVAIALAALAGEGAQVGRNGGPRPAMARSRWAEQGGAQGDAGTAGRAPTGASEALAHGEGTGLGQWTVWGSLAAALATHYYVVLALVGMGAGAAVAHWRRAGAGRGTATGRGAPVAAASPAGESREAQGPGERNSARPGAERRGVGPVEEAASGVAILTPASPHPAAPARGLAGLSQRERRDASSLSQGKGRWWGLLIPQGEGRWWGLLIPQRGGRSNTLSQRERVGVRAWLDWTCDLISPNGGARRRSVLQGAAIAILAIGAGAAWLSTASGLQTSLTVVYPRWVEPARVAGALVESVGAALAGPLASAVQKGVGAILVVALLALAGVGWRRAKHGQSGGRLWWMALGGLVAVIVGVPLLLFLGREFAPRFIVMATPFLAILVGLGSAGWSGRAAAGLSMVVGSAAVFGVAPYYGYERSDYGRAMEELRGLVTAGDAVVLNGPWQDILYRRYGQGLPPGRIIATTVPLQEDEAVGWLERLTREHPRVWVVDSATDAADPTGVVARWLDAHAYPRPVIEYRKALLRPYLTEDGASARLEPRFADVELLGMAVGSVALERWTLAPGGESRVRISVKELCGAPAEPCVSHGERRLALQLVGPSGQSVWHWDGVLTARSGGLEYRAAIVVPQGAAAGLYDLRAIVYERGSDATGSARVQRASAEEVVGVLRVAGGPGG